MGLAKKKGLILLAVSMFLLTGCTQVPVVEVPEPSQPVVSNILRYEAPERTQAPEIQGGSATGIG